MELIIPRACDDLPDILKQPMNNPPMQQILSKFSPNLYYGGDYKIGQSVDSRQIVHRMAYATGSGSRSICLEPDKFQVKKFVDEHSSLISIITSIHTRYCKQKSIHIPTNFKINAISIKTYRLNQVTRLHRDVLYDSQGKPLKNNSQVPETPSIFLSIGDDKELLFELDDKSHRKLFTQKNILVFVLDPRDEMLNDSGRYWKHSASLKENDGSAISFVFRMVKNHVHVYTDNDCLVNPPSCGTKKDERFLLYRQQINDRIHENDLTKMYKKELKDRLLSLVK